MEFTKETFKTIRKDKVETVDGYTFDYSLGEGSAKMGVYESDGKWTVVDVRTGLALQSGNTKEEAVAKSSDETVRAKYEAMVKTNGYLDKMLRFRLLCRKGYKEAEKSPEPKIDCKSLTLKGACVCITGTLSGMTRQEAFIRLKKVGGIPSEKFTSRTTVFVVGRNAGKDKQAKAEKAVEKGQAVQFVDGTTFVEELLKEEREMDEAKVRKPKAAVKPKAAAKPMPAKPKAPKKMEVKVEEVTLEIMKGWCEERGLKAKQINENSNIWVLGPSSSYKEELMAMGARWGTSKKFGKGWYINPNRK